MLQRVDQLEIVHYPDPVLRRKAAPVGAVTEDIRRLANRMIALMHEAPGVGLAAPQVGVSLRLFVANPSSTAADDRVFINPVLRDASRESADQEEGCLSLPMITGTIRRPARITIEATDLNGNRFTLTSDDLAARVWQHEFDHLEGVLIIDRMPPEDRLANQRALRELEGKK